MKNLFILLFLLNPFVFSFSQIGVNTDNPHPSAALDVRGNDKGVLFPEADTDIIDHPAVGLMVYDKDQKTILQNVGTEEAPIWKALGGGSGGNTGSGLAEYEIMSIGTAAGTIQEQHPIIRGSVAQIITVNVTKKGAYFFETKQANGVRYTATGYFFDSDVANSLQGNYSTVVLVAEGTPQGAGMVNVGFEYPETALQVPITITSVAEDMFASIAASLTSCYSKEPFALNTTVLNVNPAAQAVYTWYENGQVIDITTESILRVQRENEEPNATTGKYADKAFTYMCLVEVDGKVMFTSSVIVTVRPPWGKGGVITPGIEVIDPGTQLVYSQALEYCVDTYGSGWRLPSMDEFMKICFAELIPLCKSTTSPKKVLLVGYTPYNWGSTEAPSTASEVPVALVPSSIGNPGKKINGGKASTGTPTPFFCVRGY